jgi:hypothetical protein
VLKKRVSLFAKEGVREISNPSHSPFKKGRGSYKDFFSTLQTFYKTMLLCCSGHKETALIFLLQSNLDITYNILDLSVKKLRGKGK